MNRKDYNILKCTLVILSMFIIPALLTIIFNKYINNIFLSQVLANIVFLVLLVLLYYKELKEDYLVFKKNKLGSTIGLFNYFFIAIVVVYILNYIIYLLVGDISINETVVRSTILNSPYTSFVSVVLLTPIIEEIVFRKSITLCTKNVMLGSALCGIIFGLAHVIGYMDNPLNFLYIIPYGVFGFVFGYMNYKSNTVFSSTFYHMLNNFVNIIILLIGGNVI